MEYDLNYELIGMRIKEKRLKERLTQEILAEKVDIGTQYISKIENGKAKLSLPCLISIANSLNTTADHLLMDNIAASTPNLLEETQTLFTDCTPDEIFIIIETSKALINSIRMKSSHNSGK